MKRSGIVNTIKELSGDWGHQEVVRIYNSQNPLPRGYKLQQKDPWCAATVTAVFLQNGCNLFAECSCPAMIQKAKEAGIWQESDAYEAKPGDVIMYDWKDSGLGDDGGTADHTGIIIEVDGDWMTIREGNKGGKFGNRKMQVNSRYIRGYITPKFEEETGYKLTAGNGSGWDIRPAETTQETIPPTIWKGSKGKAVAVWQIIADAIPDGDFGAETEKATKIFQEQHGLIIDGIVGPKTWAAGLKTL